MPTHRQASPIALESPIVTAHAALPVSEAGTASRADTGAGITVTKAKPRPIRVMIAVVRQKTTTILNDPRERAEGLGGLTAAMEARRGLVGVVVLRVDIAMVKAVLGSTPVGGITAMAITVADMAITASAATARDIMANAGMVIIGTMVTATGVAVGVETVVTVANAIADTGIMAADIMVTMVIAATGIIGTTVTATGVAVGVETVVTDTAANVTVANAIVDTGTMAVDIMVTMVIAATVIIDTMVTATGVVDTGTGIMVADIMVTMVIAATVIIGTMVTVTGAAAVMDMANMDMAATDIATMVTVIMPITHTTGITATRPADLGVAAHRAGVTTRQASGAIPATASPVAAVLVAASVTVVLRRGLAAARVIGRLVLRVAALRKASARVVLPRGLGLLSSGVLRADRMMGVKATTMAVASATAQIPMPGSTPWKASSML
jgi:hypothetical protein